VVRIPACLALVAILVSDGPLVAATAPNVVMIISDDQAWTDFGFMGHPVIHTPHLDRMAEESALFRRGYVPTSLCRPSLATLISGLYPHQHKISGNDPAEGTDRQEMLKHIRRIPKLPQLLGKQGFVSHQSGKWWEGNYRLGGFTAGMTHGDPERGGRHGDFGLTIGRRGLQPVFDFMDNRAGKPFFLWYAPFLPHTPHTPPGRLLKKYTRADRPKKLAKYYAMCEWFDETCGNLLGHLDREGLSQNTLVVFVTDNGWIQRTPKTEVPPGWRFSFAPRSKRSPYEKGIRTPIMLRWPARIRPGDYGTLVSSIDLVPTIMSATGLPRDPTLPGLDLLATLAQDGRNGRDTIFGATYEHDVPDVDDPAKGVQSRWCISNHDKLILPRLKSQPVELYDLQTDPHETRNLASEHVDRVQRLTAKTDAWWSATADRE
jgi:uncharacterized sulfatase